MAACARLGTITHHVLGIDRKHRGQRGVWSHALVLVSSAQPFLDIEQNPRGQDIDDHLQQQQQQQQRSSSSFDVHCGTEIAQHTTNESSQALSNLGLEMCVAETVITAQDRSTTDMQTLQSPRALRPVIWVSHLWLSWVA